MSFQNEEKTEQKLGLTWFRADEVSVGALQELSLREITVNSKAIGILKRNDKIYAFAAKCPHAGARMCDGWLDSQGRIVCPDHKYRFDPANGRNTSGEGYKLFTYPVEIRGDDLWVGLMVS